MVRKPKLTLCVTSILVLMLWMPSAGAAGDIDMKEVRSLAKLPVETILDGVPVSLVQMKDYWKSLRGRKRPVILFFYINHNSGSQRVATLIRYVAADYKDRIDFHRVEVLDAGKPTRDLKKDLQKRFSLDDIPGILFYDNVKGEMVLEDEDYIEADFKEFRTPGMFFWKTYYSAVRRELDKLLAD